MSEEHSVGADRLAELLEEVGRLVDNLDLTDERYEQILAEARIIAGANEDLIAPLLSYKVDVVQIDAEQESRRFEEETGKSVRSWLAAWRRGEIADTLDNNLRYQAALLLEDA